MFATLTPRVVDVPTAKLVERELQDAGQYQGCFVEVEECTGLLTYPSTDVPEPFAAGGSPQ
jgi:hypothetical protein